MQEFLLELISLGAEVSLPASSGSTALHFAAVNNRKAVVEVLLRSGADPSTPNCGGFIAGELCNDTEVRALLVRDPSLLPTMFGGLSPLAMARQSMRAILLTQEATSPTRGASSHATTTTAASTIRVGMDSPSTGIHTADRFVIHSQMQSPDQLLLAPAEISHGVNNGLDAVDDAFREEEEELQELHSAVLAAATETAIAMSTLESHTARFEVVRQCQTCNPSVLRRLLEFDPSLATCRANFDKLGPDGHTPVHIAAHFNNITALTILFEVEGVSAWIRDVQGRTPLHIAAGRGHDNACQFLRERMASERRDPVGVHAPVDLAGSTPAGWAAICTKGSVSPNMRAALFQPGDKTILPRTPHSVRAGKSPKRAPAATASAAAVGGEVGSDEIVFAYSVAQGWKGEMEDKVVVSLPIAGRPLWSLFGVCDGHGGAFCSSYLAANLPRIIATVFAEGSAAPTLANDDDTTPEMLQDLLTRACLCADEELRTQPKLRVDINPNTQAITCKDASGSTGVLCLITQRYIAVGNVGDSRAVLAQRALHPPPLRAGATPVSLLSTPPYPNVDPASAGGISASAGVLVATALSTDHKYSIPSERVRAEAAGATVSAIEKRPLAAADPAAPDAPKLVALTLHEQQQPDSYEVYTQRFHNGTSRLRMSRSFGDFYLKQTSTLPVEQQAVVAVPEVVVHTRTGTDAFVVLACDGVFDVMDNQTVVDIMGSQLGYTAAFGGPAPGTQRCAEACDVLLQECLRLGAYDNLSALVVVCPAATAMPASNGAGAGAGAGAAKVSPQPLLQSPPFTARSALAETPTSGAASRTPIDRTLSRVLYSPADQFFSGNNSGHAGNEDGSGTYSDMGGGDRDGPPTTVNRHLEFSVGAPSPTTTMM